MMNTGGYTASNHGGHYGTSSSSLDFVDSLNHLDYNGAPHPYHGAIHGHGLNLSTNHGLDLTCPHYEGLNLSVSTQPSANGTPVSIQGHHGLSHGQPQSNQRPPRPPVANVGLNLSVQKQTSQATGANGNSQPFYYNSNPCSGYINLTPQNQAYHAQQQQQQQQQQPKVNPTKLFANFENPAQNSPLNLEQNRASPLNLTQQYPNQYDHSLMGNYTASNSSNLYGNGTNGGTMCSTDGYNAPLNGSYNQTPQAGPSTGYYDESMYYSGANTMATTTTTGGKDMSQSSAGYSNPVNNGKVRLFCSSCNQEFESTSALNKHMEIHNNMIMSSGSHQHHQQPQQPQEQLQPQQPIQSTSTEALGLSCTECNIQVKDQEALYHHTQRVHPPKTTQQPSLNSLGGTGGLMATDQLANCMVSTMDMCAETSAMGLQQPDLNNGIEGNPNNSTGKLDPHAPTESCLDCSLTFISGLDLRKHIDLAHQGRQSQFQYQCQICDHYFPDKASLKIHVDEHSRDKPYKCDQCGANLSSQTSLNRHMRRHETSFAFHCHDCGKGFHERHDLQRHVQRHIKLGLGPKCPNCDKSFPSEKVRDKHKCKAPLKNARYPCEICETRLETKMAWGYHMWKHTKDSKYIVMSEEDDLPTSTKERSNLGLSLFDREKSLLSGKTLADSKLIIATKS